MPKCKRCGSEYYSDSDLCYACGGRDDSIEVRHPRRHGLLVATSICIILMLLGTYIVIAGILAEDDWDPSEDQFSPTLTSVVGALVVSLGAAAASYTAFGLEYPLDMVRNGARNRSALAVFFLSFGIMTIVFDATYVIISRHLELPAVPIYSHVVLMSVSALLIAAGYLERPSHLFSADPFEDTPGRTRMAIASLLIISGLTLQIGVLAWALTRTYEASGILMLWLFIIALVLEIAGTGYLSPSGRWWISKGAIK